MPHPEIRGFVVLGVTTGPVQFTAVWPADQLDGIIGALQSAKREALSSIVLPRMSNVPGFRGHRR